MIQNESGRKTDDGGARTSTRRWNRSMMLGMAGIALCAAGISAAATWALRKAATAPEQSIEFVSESEVRIKAVPQGFTEVNQWFSERGLVYGLSLDTTLQIDGLMLSIIPAEGVTLPEGEVMLGGLVFNDAGQVVEFTAPSAGACVIIMTEEQQECYTAVPLPTTDIKMQKYCRKYGRLILHEAYACSDNVR